MMLCSMCVNCIKNTFMTISNVIKYRHLKVTFLARSLSLSL